MSDLWVEASRDIEADNAEIELTLAKMATASVWPFLALARSEVEFGHRLALAEPQIEELVPDFIVRDKVLASFREDFQAVSSLWAEGAQVPDNLKELREKRNLESLKTRDEAEDGDGDDDEDDTRHEASMEIFHVASGQWIRVAVDNEQPGNPYYGDPTPEAGPATGIESRHFPTAVPDPVDPLNGEYPAQPQAWTVPPDKAWVERPMNFGSQQQATAAQHVAESVSHYTDEGVETGTGPNPNLFAGGGEGVGGDQQAGFPADVSLPEEDERVEWYNNTPPQPIQDAAQGLGPATGARDNHGVCAGESCGRPVYRSGNEWHHLDGQMDHHVLLHADHPWVQQRLSARKQAEYKYVEQQGDKWVVKQKGTGKVLSEHDSEEDAKASFRAMMMHKHESRTSSFFDPADKSVRMMRRADVSSSDMGAGQQSADTSGSSTPNPPPSMIPGGPGAEAMPPIQQPQTIPNQSVSTNPFASGGGAPAGPPAPGTPPVTGMRHHADEYRGRPTSDNPNGVPDEFDANTWEGPAKQRPMQGAEERGVNTPQRPHRPIPQMSSTDMERPEGEQGDEEEEED